MIPLFINDPPLYSLTPSLFTNPLFTHIYLPSHTRTLPQDTLSSHPLTTHLSYPPSPHTPLLPPSSPLPPPQSWAIAEKGAGNIELARILFKQGLKKCPAHSALWQAFGVMEMQQSNFEIARTLFAQSIQRNPDHAQVTPLPPHTPLPPYHPTQPYPPTTTITPKPPYHPITPR